MELNHKSVSVSTAPTTEPITLSQAKKQLEIAESDRSHDEHVQRAIVAAREQYEADTQKKLITQTIQEITDAFPGGDYFELTYRPVASVTSIAYLDTAGASQTWAAASYSLDAARRRIWLKNGYTYPTTYDQWNAVTVTYVAGYGTQEDIPERDRQAMLLLVGYFFEDRDMLRTDAAQYWRAYERMVLNDVRSNYP